MVGKTVSHYKIESELGQGGMGIVYRATDTVLERTVALKFLPPMLSRDEDAKRRFIHEARAVSALDHPHVAVVHEIGGADSDQPFIVMAYYNGSTLEDIIADGPISLDTAVAHALAIAKGLRAAHEKGIIHRDIKPGNVMVTESGLLKILDFGLAKVQDVTMTMGAKSLGTLAYMSPEQAQGTEVDHRTDLWALGVVFYEMLCGKRPFDGPYDAAILYAAAHEAHESIANRRADAPVHLVAIIDKLLQKKPEQRYQNAADVIDDLVSLTGPTPSVLSSVIQPVQPSDGPQSTGNLQSGAFDAGASNNSQIIPSSGKKKGWMIGAAGVAFVVVCLLALQFLGGPQEIPEAVKIKVQEHLKTASGYMDTGQYDLALVELERAMELDSTHVPVWTTLASAYFQLNNFPKSVSAARKAISLDSTYAGPYYNLGLVFADQGDLEASITYLKTAILRKDDFIQAYSALSDILIEANRPEEALTFLEMASEKLPINSPLEFIVYKNQGKALYTMGKYVEAINYLEASKRLRDSWPETFYLLAQAYDQLGDSAKAIPAWERFLELENDPVKRGEAMRRLGQ